MITTKVKTINIPNHDDKYVYRDYDDISRMAYDKDALNNSLRNILTTRKGSLPGKPEFGSDIYQVPFSQLDYVTMNTFKMIIKESISVWEPRVLINNIDITSNSEYNQIIADITYQYKDKNINVNGTLSVPLGGL